MTTFSLLAWCIPCLFFISFLMLITIGKEVKLAGFFSGLIASIAFLLAIFIWIERLQPVNDDYSYHIDWFLIGELHLKIGYEMNNTTAYMLLLLTLMNVAIHVYLYIDTGLKGQNINIYACISLLICSISALILADNMFLFFIFSVLASTSIFLLLLTTDISDQEKSALSVFIWSHALGYICLLLVIILLMLHMPDQSLEFTLIQTMFNGQAWHEYMWLPSVIGLLSLVAIAAISGLIPFLHWQKQLRSAFLPIKLIVFGLSTMMLASYMFIRLAELVWQVKWITQLSSIFGLAVIVVGCAASLMTLDYTKKLSYVTGSHVALLFIAISYHAISFIAYQLMIWLMASFVLFILKLEKKPVSQHRAVYIIVALSLIGLPPLSGFWSKQWLMIYAYEGGNFAYTITIIAMLTLTSSTILMLYAWWKEPVTNEQVAKRGDSIQFWVYIALPLAILIGSGVAFSLWSEPIHTWLTGEVSETIQSFAPTHMSYIIVAVSILLCWILLTRKVQTRMKLEQKWLQIEQKSNQSRKLVWIAIKAFIASIHLILCRVARRSIHPIKSAQRRYMVRGKHTTILRSTVEIFMFALIISIIVVLVRRFLL